MSHALPESFVQRDALGLVLTEVRLGHAMVDHLVAQLAWWAGQRTEASGGRGRQQPCVCSLGVPFPLRLSLGVPAVTRGRFQGLSWALAHTIVWL